MLPDIPESGGPQKRVDHGVCHHIGIAMAEESFLSFELHAAEDQASIISEAVYVESDTDAHSPLYIVGRERDRQVRARP